MFVGNMVRKQNYKKTCSYENNKKQTFCAFAASFLVCMVGESKLKSKSSPTSFYRKDFKSVMLLILIIVKIEI